MLVQGQVLNNNLGSSLLPPDEITDVWAQSWDGAPVIVHDHPTSRGVPVSARSPEVLDSRGVGFVFRAHAVRNGTAQLKAEVWLDLDRAEQVPELNLIIHQLKSGETVELSTGFAVQIEEKTGVFNGESYDLVIRPQGADHLAIFVDKVGACAVDDGCGLGANKKEADVVAKEDADKTVLGVIATLVALIKPKLTDNTDADDPLIPARALLRSLKFAGLTNDQISEATESFKADDLDRIQRGHTVKVDVVVLLAQLQAVNAKHKLSDEDRRSMLSDGLNAAFGGMSKHVWVDAVFSEKNLVIFGVMIESATGISEELFSADFTIDEAANEVTFSDPTAVARRVVYEPVGNISLEDDQMAKTNQELEAEATAKAEADKAAEAVANAKAEADKAEADKVANTKAEADKVAAEKAEAEKAEADGVVLTAINKLTALVEKQGEEIAELREVSAPAIAETERDRTEMVEQLTANEVVPYDKAELEAKTTEDLRRLLAMSRGENYTGRGGPKLAVHQDVEPAFMAPAPYFPAKKDADKGGTE